MTHRALVPSEDKESRLAAWIREYGDALLRTCFIILSDRVQAEDALQDTFLKVWRHMDRFEGREGSSVKTWITRIAINTCKDYRRTAWFRHVDRQTAIEDLPLAAPSTEESRDLFLDVMGLPDRLKQVILLYYFHDFTMAETAQVLGISRQAVQYRLKKAYQQLGQTPEGSDLDEAEQ